MAVLRYTLQKTLKHLRSLARRYEESCLSPDQAAWLNISGDKTLRLEYPDLNQNSLVLDIGGYEGQWASDLFSKYCCTIHIFEAVPEFAQRIAARFSKNEKICVHAVGLGGTTRTEYISVDSDSSSFQRNPAGQTVQIKIQDVAEVIGDVVIPRPPEGAFGSAPIDLIKINIEGAEYELLERLLETRLIERIRNLQIQFHDFVPNACARMELLQQGLRRTHELSWHYQFVWENWVKRP